MKFGVGPYLNISIETPKELEPYQGPYLVRFGTQNFFRIWMFAIFDKTPYWVQIGVF